MDGSKTVGMVGANRQQRDLRSKASTDLSKATKVCGVPRVIKRVLSSVQNIATEAALRIAKKSRAPVPCGSTRYFDAGDPRRSPEIQRHHLVETKIVYKIRHPDRNYHDGPVPIPLALLAHDPSQRSTIEVVHVRVRKQHHIDDWKLFKKNARMTKTSQHNNAAGKNRINQQMAPVHLDEKRRVPDERHTEITFRGNDGFAGDTTDGVKCGFSNQRT